jgi:hypothetical protein
MNNIAFRARKRAEISVRYPTRSEFDLLVTEMKEMRRQLDVMASGAPSSVAPVSRPGPSSIREASPESVPGLLHAKHPQSRNDEKFSSEVANEQSYDYDNWLEID